MGLPVQAHFQAAPDSPNGDSGSRTPPQLGQWKGLHLNPQFLQLATVGLMGTSQESESECGHQASVRFCLPELAGLPHAHHTLALRGARSHRAMAPGPHTQGYAWLPTASRCLLESKLINKGPSLTVSKYCRNEGTSLPTRTHVRAHRP